MVVEARLSKPEECRERTLDCEVIGSHRKFLSRCVT